MLYRLVRTTHRGYALAIFWMYVAAFAIAFCFMFILPLVTISLVFVAIFGLAVAYCGELILGGIEHVLARRFLRRNICPGCRLEAMDRTAADRITCLECGATFDPSGVETEFETIEPAAT